ncbi:MAG: flagellar motor protein MotA [Hyphomicrobium sp.]|nr:MAG: flagellar motor protein MotA [Hyphomicrobium sp.]PPC99422.1 MAG: flagellar motor protein MotA [Hyphomicrobium sp.]
MIGLVLASVVCWALIFEKMFRIWRLNREVGHLEDAAGAGALPHADRNGLNSEITNAAKVEWNEGTRTTPVGELRDRLEQAMRAAMKRELKGIEKGLPFLATLGSAAPFIGLFGTVWGIMNSFTAIARSKDTSLAVVAPGIAEALFATAIGLAAAIPAVIAYNQFTVALGRSSDKIGPAISDLARTLSRRGIEGAK